MSETVVLRSRGIYGIAWACVVASIVVFPALAVTEPGPDPQPSDYVVLAIYGAACALLSLRATRMRVELADSDITVYRLFRTFRVPWQDVEDIAVDYHGLHIICRTGKVLTAGSLGKSNLSSWLGSRTSADERADQLRAAVEARTHGAQPGPEPEPPFLDASSA